MVALTAPLNVPEDATVSPGRKKKSPCCCVGAPGEERRTLNTPKLVPVLVNLK
jgi:hypothetical protein